jgi:hypothetical protein
MEPTNQGEVKLSQAIQIDKGKIQEHLGEVVRGTAEETLNAMLDAEADRLCRAGRYERAEARKDTRVGSYHLSRPYDKPRCKMSASRYQWPSFSRRTLTRQASGTMLLVGWPRSHLLQRFRVNGRL